MIQNLFPTLVYKAPLFSTTAKMKSVNKDIKDEALKYSEIDDQGIAWSKKNYPGGYTSYGSIDKLHQISTTFEDLEKQIFKHVKKYVQTLEMDISANELFMSSCWINVMPTQVNHSMHLHPLSVISGTYYVQTPKNCSAIKFEDPRLDSFMASPPRKEKARVENQRYFSLTPEAGTLVLFESWLRHEVPRNEAKDQRISISFNYNWR